MKDYNGIDILIVTTLVILVLNVGMYLILTS